jgi:hypothetical protein
MANKAFKKTYTTNQDLNNMQENVEEVVAPLLKNPLLDGQILSNIELTTGSNSISHKLGRKLQGWVIVDKDDNSNIYRETSSTPTLTLVLNSSANVTISLYVF